MTRVAPIDGFEIKAPIGRGGSSRVYLARQIDFDREVAIKVLATGFDSDGQRAAFERECAAIGKLSQHPNIVTVFDTATSTDGEPCIVMQHYAGGTLKADETSKANGSELDLEAALSIGIRICGALHTAHAGGVIHRDLKPSNLFLSEYGEPALGDFGISSLSDDVTVTGAGGGLTLHYAPPEILDGGSATVRSDIYSLAATLFTLISGDRLFRANAGQTAGELARRILVEPAPRLDPDLGPATLADLLASALEKNPADRPPSALDFGHRLQVIEQELGFPPSPITTPDQGSTSLNPTSAGESALAGASVPTKAIESRRIVSALLAVVAVLGIAVVASVLANDDTSPDNATGTTRTTQAFDPDDAFFSAPAIPSNVEVTAGADGGLLVSWSPVEPDVVYEIEASGGTSGELVSATSSPAEIAIADGDAALCIIIRAIGPGGRLSGDSSPVCHAP